MLPNGKHTGTYSDVLQTQAGAMQMHERQAGRRCHHSAARLS